MAGSMSDSILDTIKEGIDIDPSDTSFDSRVITCANTVFQILYRLGVNRRGYHIESDKETWADYIGNEYNLSSIKSFMILKVKEMFDPSTLSTVAEANRRVLGELESSIIMEVEHGEYM